MAAIYERWLGCVVAGSPAPPPPRKQAAITANFRAIRRETLKAAGKPTMCQDCVRNRQHFACAPDTCCCICTERVDNLVNSRHTRP